APRCRDPIFSAPTLVSRVARPFCDSKKRMIQSFLSSNRRNSMSFHNTKTLSNYELVNSLKSQRVQERTCQVAILEILIEMDARRLYAEEGYSSLFSYCLGELKYAEGTTARLIHTARACAKHPVVFDYLRDGRLNPTSVSILAAALKDVRSEEHTS